MWSFVTHDHFCAKWFARSDHVVQNQDRISNKHFATQVISIVWHTHNKFTLLEYVVNISCDIQYYSLVILNTKVTSTFFAAILKNCTQYQLNFKIYIYLVQSQIEMHYGHYHWITFVSSTEFLKKLANAKSTFFE